MAEKFFFTFLVIGFPFYLLMALAENIDRVKYKNVSDLGASVTLICLAGMILSAVLWIWS